MTARERLERLLVLVDYASVTGVPCGLKGKHVTGPVKGTSVIRLAFDLHAEIKGILAQVEEDDMTMERYAEIISAEPVVPVQTTGEGPSLARFRNLEFADD